LEPTTTATAARPRIRRLSRPSINEEEAISIGIANNELDQLAIWDNLGVQLRESWLTRGPLPSPPMWDNLGVHADTTHTRASSLAPSPAWNPWPPSPQAPPSSPTAGSLPPLPPVYQLPWWTLKIIELVGDDEQ
jgi:hypothetical protein